MKVRSHSSKQKATVSVDSGAPMQTPSMTNESNNSGSSKSSSKASRHSIFGSLRPSGKRVPSQPRAGRQKATTNNLSSRTARSRSVPRPVHTAGGIHSVTPERSHSASPTPSLRLLASIPVGIETTPNASIDEATTPKNREQLDGLRRRLFSPTSDANNGPVYPVVDDEGEDESMNAPLLASFEHQHQTLDNGSFVVQPNAFDSKAKPVGATRHQPTEKVRKDATAAAIKPDSKPTLTSTKLSKDVVSEAAAHPLVRVMSEERAVETEATKQPESDPAAASSRGLSKARNLLAAFMFQRDRSQKSESEPQIMAVDQPCPDPSSPVQSDSKDDSLSPDDKSSTGSSSSSSSSGSVSFNRHTPDTVTAAKNASNKFSSFEQEEKKDDIADPRDSRFNIRIGQENLGTRPRGSRVPPHFSQWEQYSKEVLKQCAESEPARKILQFLRCGNDMTNTALRNFPDEVTPSERQVEERPLYDEEFTLRFLKDMTSAGITVFYLQAPGTRHNPGSEWNGRAVSMIIEPGATRGIHHKDPKLEWSIFSGGTRSEVYSNSVSLLSIHSIASGRGLDAEDKVSEKVYFTITTDQGISHIFEASSSDECRIIVNGLHNVLARLAYHLIVGDTSTALGLYPASTPCMRPDQAVNQLAHILLD